MRKWYQILTYENYNTKAQSNLCNQIDNLYMTLNHAIKLDYECSLCTEPMLSSYSDNGILVIKRSYRLIFSRMTTLFNSLI